VRAVHGGVWRWNYSVTALPVHGHHRLTPRHGLHAVLHPSCFVPGPTSAGGSGRDSVVPSPRQRVLPLILTPYSIIIHHRTINAQQIVTARRTALHFCPGLAWLRLCYGLVGARLVGAPFWAGPSESPAVSLRPGHSLPIKGSGTRTLPRTGLQAFRFFFRSSVLLLAN